MKEEVQKIQQARGKLYSDFYNNIIPERMFVGMSVSSHILAEFGGLDVFKVQYDYSQLAEPAKKMCDMIYSDTIPVRPVGLISRPPSFYQLLGSQSFVMGNRGFVQHPEVVGMYEDEYPELIADPYSFLLEKVIPRQYKELDASNPVRMLNRMQMAKAALKNDSASSMPWFLEMMDKHGYHKGAPPGSGGFSEAPYDFIADQLRSFSGISKDIRRHRSELKEACDAVLPLMFRMGLPANPHAEGSVMTPLHMPTFMREKDFMEVWMPSYKKMYEQYAALGIRGSAFCEDDWMRYLDNLLELPSGMVLMFEYGDPQQIKDKLGKKFIIQGLYPIDLIKHGTKEQCVNKAKELLDIMMPGGGYVFGFDKGPLTLSDINLENLAAVAETVRDYGVYENAGESFGTPVNSEGFVFDESIASFKSKHLFNWDEFKAQYPLVPDSARANFEKYDKELFDLYMLMLI
ncbi:MAG TPA: uroporphyrinogen decarboxylase family protein [Oscillospiraceae bacterium]|nr:uroporphyrinogen decarboxylase family protein [Oscillospiraceae bacterium]